MSNQPRSHSPLRSLGLKVLLFGILPVLAAGIVLYVLTGQPSQRSQAARELEELVRKSNEPDRQLAQEAYERAAAHPDAARNQALMENMTPDEQAQFRKQLEDEWKRKNGFD